MADICVLRKLLSLISHMDQDIEALTFAVPVENRLELLLMQPYQLLHGVTESIQQTVVFLTTSTA